MISAFTNLIGKGSSFLCSMERGNEAEARGLMGNAFALLLTALPELKSVEQKK